MRSPVGNGSPKSWWILQLWERAGRSSRSGLVLGVLMLALPGCMTTGHQSAKSLDSSVRSAPPRGALNDPPTNQKPTLPGLLENPVVRGQDPGADQEGGPQDAGSAAVVAPAGSAPPLPQPNPPAPVPPADNLASAPPDFALDPVANPVGAAPPASPGSALASAAAGRPLANPAGPQVSGLSSIAQSSPARGRARNGTGVQLSRHPCRPGKNLPRSFRHRRGARPLPLPLAHEPDLRGPLAACGKGPQDRRSEPVPAPDEGRHSRP